MTAPRPAGPPEVEIAEVGAERLDDIERLWCDMHEHDAAVGGVRDIAPFRAAGDAWRRGRGRFESWMAAGTGRLLIAERDGSPVGFAFFRTCAGDPGFATGERMAELVALSVEPELRRWGVGSLLMEAVEDRLSAAGIDHIALNVVSGNDDALRFYERWGILPSHVRCLGRVMPPAGDDP
ncbi:MAG: GNAT family N-acetyltransferase [Solirubrobacterales bacterium]